MRNSYPLLHPILHFPNHGPPSPIYKGRLIFLYFLTYLITQSALNTKLY